MAKGFDKNFKPWVTNLVWFIFAPLIWSVGYKFLWPNYFDYFLVYTALCVGFAVWHFKQLILRTRGQRIERKALKKLTGFLGNDFVRTGVPLPAGGDADAVIKKNGVYANIEIKSVTLIERVRKAHLYQVRKASTQLKSTPVIWLPKGTDNRGIELMGVFIYSGDHKGLCRFIGVS